MYSFPIEDLVFVKSPYSQPENCVEVAKLPDGGRAIRDSKNPDGPVQFYTPEEWTAFKRGVKDDFFG